MATTAVQHMSPSTRQLATLLAALRYWQREGLMSSGHELDIASDGGTIEPLSLNEIDALCDELNDDETPAPAVVIEVNGGAIYSVRASMPVMVVILDADTEGSDAENLNVINGEEVNILIYHIDANDGVEPEFVAGVIDQIKVCEDLQAADGHAVPAVIPQVSEADVSHARNGGRLPFTLVIDAYSVNEFGDSPAFATVTVTQAFLERLQTLAGECEAKGLELLAINMAPDAWDLQEQLNLCGDKLFVSEHRFWFLAHPKHSSYDCETRGMEIGDLLHAISTGESKENLIWKDGVLYYAGDESTAKSLIDMHQD